MKKKNNPFDLCAFIYVSVVFMLSLKLKLQGPSLQG